MRSFVKKYCSVVIFALLFWPVGDILANRLSLPAPGGNPGPARENPAAQTAPEKAQKSPSSQHGAKMRPDAAQGDASAAGTLPDGKGDGGSESAQAGEPPLAGRAEDRTSQPGASGSSAGSSPDAGAQAGEEGPANSLASLGEKRADADGEPLLIPAPAESIDFLAGAWNFERTFVGSDGSRYTQDFIFNADGRGRAILRDEKENLFVADAMAQTDGSALRIVTGPFIDEKTGSMYAPEYIECKNGATGAICGGTDGFFAWQGERLLRDNSGLAYLPENHRSGKIEKGTSGSVPQASGQSASGAGQGDQGASGRSDYSDSKGAPAGKQAAEQSGQALNQGSYAELSADGAELSPVIMEKSSKAGGDAKTLSLASLAGDWRYSRDFARRDDGRSLGLEFHFDNAGKGYSVITDESGNGVKAGAEASMTKNGHVRVRTDAYGNSFYPTFMECRPGKPDLLCDVSNGWTRMENGKLVSLRDNGSKSHQDQMADILQMPTQNGQEGAARSSSVADILSDFPPGETSPSSGLTSSASSRNARSSSSAQMVLPKSGDGMEFLQGRWRCNTGLVRMSDNKPVVVEFSFNKNGQGNALIREHSGTVYRASAKASMRKGILRINTSQFQSQTSGGRYNKCFIECRDNGSQAICSGENGGIHWDNATFVRTK